MSGYDGHVESDGPAAVRTLDHLEISKLSVGGRMDNNAYLLRCLHTGDALLIDAANDADRLLALIGAAPLRTIVTTHQHRDHWQALDAVVRPTKASTVAGRHDAAGIPVPTDRLVDDGDTIAVGECSLSVIHLVGHTPGSIALLYADPAGTPHLFTGDSLFPGGVGNTRGSAEAFTSLFNDVVGKVFDRLPDETWVYPGHGDDTTLGAERPHLGEWRDRGW